MAFGRKKRRQLSIIFDDYTIRFLEVTTKNNQITTIHHISTIDNSVMADGVLDKEKWNKVLKKFLKENKIKAKLANIVIPSSSVIFRQQALPDLPLKDLKEIIKYEIGNTIHLPFSNPIYDIIKLESVQPVINEDGQEAKYVSLVAASGALIYPLLAVLKKNKLKANKIDIPALSLYRLFSNSEPGQSREVVLLSYVSINGVDIHILDNGILAFTRHVPLEITNFIHSGADGSVQPDKLNHQSLVLDFGYEVERAINFFQYTLNNRDKRIGICLVASDLDFPGDFYSSLKERIEIDVQPLYYKNGNQDGIDRFKGYEIGLGTFLKETDDKYQVNLLPKVPKFKKYRIPILVGMSGLIIGTGIFLGMLGWGKAETLTSRNSQLEQLITEREAKLNTLNHTEEEADLSSAYILDYNSLMEQHLNIVPYLDDLSKLLPSDGSISNIDWAEKEFMTFMIEFPSIDATAQYLQLLNQLEWIDKAVIVEIKDKQTFKQAVINIKINLEAVYQKGENNHE